MEWKAEARAARRKAKGNQAETTIVTTVAKVGALPEIAMLPKGKGKGKNWIPQAQWSQYIPGFIQRRWSNWRPGYYKGKCGEKGKGKGYEGKGVSFAGGGWIPVPIPPAGGRDRARLAWRWA